MINIQPRLDAIPEELMEFVFGPKLQLELQLQENAHWWQIAQLDLKIKMLVNKHPIDVNGLLLQQLLLVHVSIILVNLIMLHQEDALISLIGIPLSIIFVVTLLVNVQLQILKPYLKQNVTPNQLICILGTLRLMHALNVVPLLLLQTILQMAIIQIIMVPPQLTQDMFLV